MADVPSNYEGGHSDWRRGDCRKYQNEQFNIGDCSSTAPFSSKFITQARNDILRQNPQIVGWMGDNQMREPNNDKNMFISRWESCGQSQLSAAASTDTEYLCQKLKYELKCKGESLFELDQAHTLLKEENLRLSIQLTNERRKAALINQKIKYIQENQSLLLRLKDEYTALKTTKTPSCQTLDREAQTSDFACNSCLATAQWRQEFEQDRLEKHMLEKDTISVKESELTAIENTVNLLKERIQSRSTAWNKTGSNEQKYKGELESLKAQLKRLNDGTNLKQMEWDKMCKSIKIKNSIIEKQQNDKAVLKNIIIKLEKRQRAWIKKNDAEECEKRLISDKEDKIVQHIIQRYRVKRTGPYQARVHSSLGLKVAPRMRLLPMNKSGATSQDNSSWPNHTDLVNISTYSKPNRVHQLIDDSQNESPSDSLQSYSLADSVKDSSEDYGCHMEKSSEMSEISDDELIKSADTLPIATNLSSDILPCTSSNECLLDRSISNHSIQEKYVETTDNNEVLDLTSKSDAIFTTATEYESFNEATDSYQCIEKEDEQVVGEDVAACTPHNPDIDDQCSFTETENKVQSAKLHNENVRRTVYQSRSENNKTVTNEEASSRRRKMVTESTSEKRVVYNEKESPRTYMLTQMKPDQNIDSTELSPLNGRIDNVRSRPNSHEPQRESSPSNLESGDAIILPNVRALRLNYLLNRQHSSSSSHRSLNDTDEVKLETINAQKDTGDASLDILNEHRGDSGNTDNIEQSNHDARKLSRIRQRSELKPPVNYVDRRQRANSSSDDQTPPQIRTLHDTSLLRNTSPKSESKVKRRTIPKLNVENTTKERSSMKMNARSTDRDNSPNVFMSSRANSPGPLTVRSRTEEEERRSRDSWDLIFEKQSKTKEEFAAILQESDTRKIVCHTSRKEDSGSEKALHIIRSNSEIPIQVRHVVRKKPSSETRNIVVHSPAESRSGRVEKYLMMPTTPDSTSNCRYGKLDSNYESHVESLHVRDSRGSINCKPARTMENKKSKSSRTNSQLLKQTILSKKNKICEVMMKNINKKGSRDKNEREQAELRSEHMIYQSFPQKRQIPRLRPKKSFHKSGDLICLDSDCPTADLIELS